MRLKLVQPAQKHLVKPFGHVLFILDLGLTDWWKVVHVSRRSFIQLILHFKELFTIDSFNADQAVLCGYYLL